MYILSVATIELITNSLSPLVVMDAFPSPIATPCFTLKREAWGNCADSDKSVAVVYVTNLAFFNTPCFNLGVSGILPDNTNLLAEGPPSKVKLVVS